MKAKKYVRYVSYGNSKNKFDYKIENLLNCMREEVEIVFYIERTDMHLLFDFENYKIIWEGSNFIVITIINKKDLKRICSYLSEGELRFSGLVMLQKNTNLEYFCLNNTDIRQFNFNDSELMNRGVLCFYYSENYAETEILVIEKSFNAKIGI